MYSNFNHDEYARTKQRSDFWGQIRRTQSGQPVDENQIKLIVDSIVFYLEISKSDTIIDLACGNGALSSKIQSYCEKIIGIDSSEYLISVAKEFFESEELNFSCTKIEDFIAISSTIVEPCNKLLCYGSFAYFDDSLIDALLKWFEATPNFKYFFIGNLPNKLKYKNFFVKSIPDDFRFEDYTSTIGRWWSPGEFQELMASYKLKCSISFMNEEFYGANFRFDALITK